MHIAEKRKTEASKEVSRRTKEARSRKGRE
jgi:hypothetical protein